VIFKNKNFLSNLKFKASFKLRKSLQQLCSITEDRNRQNIQYTTLNAHEYSDGGYTTDRNESLASEAALSAVKDAGN